VSVFKKSMNVERRHKRSKINREIGLLSCTEMTYHMCLQDTVWSAITSIQCLQLSVVLDTALCHGYDKRGIACPANGLNFSK